MNIIQASACGTCFICFVAYCIFWPKQLVKTLELKYVSSKVDIVLTVGIYAYLVGAILFVDFVISAIASNSTK